MAETYLATQTISQARALWQRLVHGEPMLFPNAYAWLLLVSALDGMCTWMVLKLGGAEVNPIADAVLATQGFAGMVFFKFAMITLVIVFCENIGRERPRTALSVIVFGIVVTCIPVVWALLQISAWIAVNFPSN